MNNEVEIGVFEDFFGSGKIAEIDLIKLGLLARDFFNLVENGDLAVAEIVENFDFMALGQKFNDDVRADVASAASGKNFHKTRSLIK